MISLHDQQCVIEEQDDGDQFQRGPFPPGYYPDGGALVCRVPAQGANRLINTSELSSYRRVDVLMSLCICCLHRLRCR